MKNPSDQLITQYKRYMSIIKKYDGSNATDKANKAIKRAGDKVYNLCQKEGLNFIDTCSQLHSQIFGDKI